MSKISMWDGIMPYYLWVKCLQTRSWKDCRIPLIFGLWWHCMIKRLLETMGHQTINNSKVQWNFILIKWWEIGISKPGTMLCKEDQLPRVTRESKACVEKVEECFQWKSHGQCSKGDSCSFSHDPLASGNRCSRQRPKGRSSSPAFLPKVKQTNGKKSDTEENSDKRSQILCCSKKCNNPSGMF